MVARAARSPRSALRGVLLAFQPLTLSWFGKGEVRTLARAEWIGGYARPQGEALMCGFYLNELLLRLLPREDPHDALFARYADALRQLASGNDSAPVLRSFERALLKELGYAMALERDSANGSAIDPAKTYRYDPERGPIEAGEAASELVISGRTLLDMARDDYTHPLTQQQAKALMRTLLNHRLEYQPLKSRRVFRDLLAL
jgi:DNA repair protein RecO (recombination protein O)